MFGPYGAANFPDELALQAAGRIAGTLTRAGVPVPGRELLLTRGGPDTHLTVTDAEGRFAFEALAPRPGACSSAPIKT